MTGKHDNSLHYMFSHLKRSEIFQIILLIQIFFHVRHRRVDEDSMTLGAKCCFTFLMLITQILLHGVVGLVLYWVWMFHKGDAPSKTFYFDNDISAYSSMIVFLYEME